MGLMALCAVIVLKMLSGAKRKAEQVTQGAALGPGMAAGLLTAGEGEVPAEVMRRQIAAALKRNPDQVRQLFSSWIREE